MKQGDLVTTHDDRGVGIVLCNDGAWVCVMWLTHGFKSWDSPDSLEVISG